MVRADCFSFAHYFYEVDLCLEFTLGNFLISAEIWRVDFGPKSWSATVWEKIDQRIHIHQEMDVGERNIFSEMKYLYKNHWRRVLQPSRRSDFVGEEMKYAINLMKFNGPVKSVDGPQSSHLEAFMSTWAGQNARLIWLGLPIERPRPNKLKKNTQNYKQFGVDVKK